MCRGRIVDSEDGAGRQEEKREMRYGGGGEGRDEDAGQD